MSNKRFCPSTVELMAPGAPLALRIRREVPDIAIEPKVAQALFRGICCCAAGGETCSASLGESDVPAPASLACAARIPAYACDPARVHRSD
jgi:hypothetical protein